MSGLPPCDAALLENVPRYLSKLVLGSAPTTRPCDRVDHWPELANGVRTAGRGVVVGSVDERFDCDPNGIGLSEAGAPQFLERTAREHRAGTHRVVLKLLIAATRDVIGEQAANALVMIEAREEGDDG